MKISIITVVYNRKATVERAINSVLNQTYSNIEYIIVDGGSTDGTLEIINKYKNKVSKIVSEKDKGIYDALNKGIKLATGEVVGIIHSDDTFTDNEVIQKIASAFQVDENLDSVYGDIAFINPEGKIIRYFSSSKFNIDRFSKGFMPAHPSFFCRKKCFDKFGYYSLEYDITADFDLLVRFLKIHKISTKYLPLCTTHMNTGGKSTSGIKSTIGINKEFLRILTSHGISSNYLKLYSRYFEKIFELR